MRFGHIVHVRPVDSNQPGDRDFEPVGTRQGYIAGLGYSIAQHWDPDSCKSVAWAKSLKPTSLCENRSADNLEPVPLSSLPPSLSPSLSSHLS